ncbi:MAG: hypothetical protein H0U16_06125, partial [Actinobacteria bacterium]|nr:hypothetical protein [Actinomycetota bacterium]
MNVQTKALAMGLVFAGTAAGFAYALPAAVNAGTGPQNSPLTSLPPSDGPDVPTTALAGRDSGGSNVILDALSRPTERGRGELSGAAGVSNSNGGFEPAALVLSSVVTRGTTGSASQSEPHGGETNVSGGEDNGKSGDQEDSDSGNVDRPDPGDDFAGGGDDDDGDDGDDD